MEEGDDELLCQRVKGNRQLVVRELLESGATFASMRDGSILHRALYADDERMMELLLEHGAPLTYREEGLPILHAAMRNRHAGRLAEILLRYGADVNVRDDRGRTVFFGLCWEFNTAPEVIPLLERYGAIPDLSVAVAQVDLPRLREFVVADPDAVRNDPTDRGELLFSVVTLANGTPHQRVECLEFLVAHGVEFPREALDFCILQFDANAKATRNCPVAAWVRGDRKKFD